MATKKQLRERIDEAGGTQPPASATHADLLAAVNELADAPPAGISSSVSDRPARRRPPSRCLAGRPLLTDQVCRRCHLAGLDTCPEVPT